MNTLHVPASGGSTQAVRLVGIGATGRRFVERFHALDDSAAETPLGDLLDQPPVFIEIGAGEAAKATGTVEALGLDAARILCIAFGMDANRTEIEAAVLLIWRMWGQDAHVIGIVVGVQDAPPPRSWHRGETMLDILCQSLDGRIDVADACDPVEMAPIQWFFVALQRSVLGGTTLDAAWDCCDIVETLDFREVQLVLFTQPFDEANQLGAAVDEAIEELGRQGVDLEQARGAIAVLWTPLRHKLTVQMMRRLSSGMGLAMGAGALHLTIRLRSGPTIVEQSAALTLIVSVPRATTGR